jgi:hypothetical protein
MNMNKGLLVAFALSFASLAHTGEALASGIPANAPIGAVRVRMQTGDDDKRDDSRVWIVVTLKSGATAVAETNDGVDWKNWTWGDWTVVALPSNTNNQDVASVTVEWRHGGNGFNGDNWNLESLEVQAFDNATNEWSEIGSATADPLLRFNGDDNRVYPWTWTE